MDLGPGVDVDDLGPTMLNEYCHGVSKSVAFCSPGMFLCQADTHPGWKFFLRGLQTWRQTSPVLPEHTDEGWKGFLLNYGLHLALEKVFVATGEHKLCILLPYRDGCQRMNRARVGERAAHLKHFLTYMQDFLMSSGHVAFDFVVMNQTDRGLFNKGVLYNVGANVAVARGCDFVALHDVDHLPTVRSNTYSWPDRPIHLCTNSSSDIFLAHTVNDRNPIFGDWAGGVVLLQLKQFAIVNGFSNLYNGWGHEDKDFYYRVKQVFGPIDRLDRGIGHYKALGHSTKLNRVPESRQNWITVQRQMSSRSREVMDADGYMNFASYARISGVEVMGNVITLAVDILADGIIQEAC
jgi:hypothetical protein